MCLSSFGLFLVFPGTDFDALQHELAPELVIVFRAALSKKMHSKRSDESTW